jgi:signal transduction histidine kinase
MTFVMLFTRGLGGSSNCSGEGKLDQITQRPGQKWSRWLRLVIYVFCAAAFVADVTHQDILAFGVFYIPLVGTAVFHRNPMAPWWLAAVATTLVIIGFFAPGLDTEIVAGLTNRVLSIVAIVITAYLIHHEGQIRSRLAAQTERAEAADRAKTQLFTNLTHEVRTPLAAILGFADLLMAKARADQKGSIGHIQSSGRRLLATLDNLIDLTQIRDRTLRIRQIDLAAVLSQAVEDSRALALDKEVALTLAPPEPALPRVMADGWALRRITDNLIANGIKFTDTGGSVEVSAHPGELGAIVTVRDTGPGMPPAVLEQIGVPFYQADSGISRRFEGMGAGLALSLRLADGMGAALHFDSAPGNGTTASLVLPASG